MKSSNSTTLTWSFLSYEKRLEWSPLCTYIVLILNISEYNITWQNKTNKERFLNYYHHRLGGPEITQNSEFSIHFQSFTKGPNQFVNALKVLFSTMSTTTVFYKQ